MIRVGRVAHFAAIGAAAAVLWLSPATAADQTLPGATVESVVAIAKRLNPTVAAAALEFDAAVHKIGTAGVLADPTLILEAWDVNRQGVGQRRIGVDQEIKLWGKYGLERNVALADADAAKFQGRATAEIEAATADGDVVRRQGEQKAAAARLNALIGRPSLAPLAAPTGFRALKAVSLAQVQALARSANPMLALAGAQSNSAAQTKSLTDLNYYPDVTLGAKYVQRPGTEDTGEFMLGVKLPLHYEVKDAEQRAAGARLGTAQARSEALRLRIDGQIGDAWFSVDALRKVVQIYASRQLPPARSSLDNARNGFQAGTSDISSVFEAERRHRAVQLDLLKLKVELQTKYSEMERLAGGSL